MLIRVGYDLKLNFAMPQHAVLMLSIHHSHLNQLRTKEELKIEPLVPYIECADWLSNRCIRINTSAGSINIFNDAIVEDNGKPVIQDYKARQMAVDELPIATLPYLLSSRYCEVDLMGTIAWDLFGNTPPGFARVKAICDWVHNHIHFDYQRASQMRTALGAYNEGIGVCRDYTHLAITFCRAMHIPARYVSGYLGDIGVPREPYPMDFSSWLEVYLDNKWHIFDPRHNIPRIGYVATTYGRDAADAPLITTFGRHLLEEFIVWTYEISEEELINPGPPQKYL